MGVAFKDIIKSRETEIGNLEGKTIFLDAHNVLYQFLTTIRGRDGSLLTDSKDNVTSHLVGLFSRTTHLMQKGVKVAYVFDGKPPELKTKTMEERHAVKEEAAKKYAAAKEKEDVEEMKKYASRTSKLTREMSKEAESVVEALGLPVIHAPSEAEAQAAYMVSKGEGYAVGSQDFDSLIHGATKLIRNLSIAGKRKKGISYQTVKPEIIDLSENLNELGIDQNQLIALAMIVGTDYNPKGIKGIGPKGALKLVKQYKSDFDSLFSEVKWDENFEFPWNEVYYTIKKMPMSDDYNLEWKDFDKEKLTKILVDNHDFSEERVDSSLEKFFEFFRHPRNQQVIFAVCLLFFC